MPLIEGIVTGVVRVSAGDEKVPAKCGGGVLAAILDQFDDMAMCVFWPWIGLVDLLRCPPGVIGQHDVDFASFGMGFYVLRPVHLGGLKEIRRMTCGDEHVCLGIEVVSSGQRALAENQRHPLAGAIVAEFRDIECPSIQQIHIGGAIAKIVTPCADELVEIFEATIITRIHHCAAVLIDHSRSSFMPESAESRTFYRHRPRIVGIDFDNPTESEWLMGLFGHVEAIVMATPSVLVLYAITFMESLHRLIGDCLY